ncbi:MAG: Digeranylgeranylglycerophospholipid reductase [Candidatus Methanolliviera sp. GoM_oil]|nr:MAG: Digeranylgeranylglycerophospholipid reductase [Candidatus Methanolliviera sp. GoM_oil]
MEHYDVVIVGAGPAGLTAAKILGETGRDVIVLEKLPKDRIGDKLCAGGLPPHGIKYVPKRLLERRVKNIILHVNDWKGTIYRSDRRPFFYTIDRLKVGQYQMAEAEIGGATILPDSRVVSLNREEHTISFSSEYENEGKKIRYSYLIGSDGSNSVIARGLGFKNDNAMAVQWFIKPRWDCEVVINDDLGLAYGWIFPQNEYASVGVGTMPRFMPMGRFRRIFEDWCYQHDIQLEGKVRAAPIKFNYDGFNFGDIFLVGDAASFNFTTAGEGIYQAMRSGEIAANAIIDERYKWKKEIKRLLRYHRRGAPAIYLHDHLPKGIRRFLLRRAIHTVPFGVGMMDIPFSPVDRIITYFYRRMFG